MSCPMKRIGIGKCPMNNRNMVETNLDEETVEGLSSKRMVSSISQDKNNKWIYPSELMFWNALKRKNKLDGVEKKDIATIIPIHNNLNEKTWKIILMWEKNISLCENDPTLLHFSGKSTILSLKARIDYFLGKRKEYPFDRHDWVIERSNGEQLRYIIDYYSNDNGGDFIVDARPASDTFGMWLFKMRLYLGV